MVTFVGEHQIRCHLVLHCLDYNLNYWTNVIHKWMWIQMKNQDINNFFIHPAAVEAFQTPTLNCTIKLFKFIEVLLIFSPFIDAVLLFKAVGYCNLWHTHSWRNAVTTTVNKNNHLCRMCCSLAALWCMQMFLVKQSNMRALHLIAISCGSAVTNVPGKQHVFHGCFVEQPLKQS